MTRLQTKRAQASNKPMTRTLPARRSTRTGTRTVPQPRAAGVVGADGAGAVVVVADEARASTGTALPPPIRTPTRTATAAPRTPPRAGAAAPSAPATVTAAVRADRKSVV